MGQIRKSRRKGKTDPPGFVMTVVAALVLAVAAKLLIPTGTASFDSSLWVFNLKGAGDLAAYVIVFLLLLFAIRFLSRFGREDGGDGPSATQGGDQP